MSDAEQDQDAAAGVPEQPADAQAHDADAHERQINALFDDDEDEEDAPSDGGQAKGKRQPRPRRGQAGSEEEEEEEEEIATARSLKAKNKSELKQRLQRLAQGKKAESGARARAPRVAPASAQQRNPNKLSGGWARREKDKAQDKGCRGGRRAGQEGRGEEVAALQGGRLGAGG
jgi:hypothetical protein